ncbi:LTA synthase family protein [uncultured Photobacterium sp.]|uniref:LTA synthase family protein n=1 Tax=uncultured Photobacterium sp. TaxID=173973 RepID=UPI00262D6041|nr:alkaline phosphatase family protein [uncultured Photobacterium sp.]
MRNKVNLRPLFYLCSLSLLALIAYSLIRFIFYIDNSDYFVRSDFQSILIAFLHGVRFDLASIAMINAPLLLLVFLLSPFKAVVNRLPKFIFYFFLLLNIPFLLSNFADIAYFPFSGRRSGLEVMALAPDLIDQGQQLAGQFWYLAALAIIFVFALTRISSRWLYDRLPSLEVRLILYPLLVIALVAITVVSARGGLQSKPIRSVHAYSWPSAELGPLVLNTSFTLIKKKGSEIKPLHFFESDKQARELITNKIASKPEHTAPNDNVIIIILESFGLEYFGPPYGKVGYTPFLQSLAEQGTFFPNGFANGRRSIEAVPTILAGIPSLMSEPLVRSAYQGNTLYGIGNILKPYNYETWFFHGAKNGSMYFDAISLRLGMDNYIGRTEYANDGDYDGNWGIFDEPFLQNMAQTLNSSPTPFLASVFTLSSHNPYTLPPEYKGKIAEGSIPMHRVVRYTDMALKKFFETIKSMPWYQDTLFVITADHTSDNHDPDFATPLGRHRVPILLYHPGGKIKPEVRLDVAQQADIPATVVDYLNINESDKLLPFGQSLLKSERQGIALFKEINDYWLVSDNAYVRMNQKLQISNPQPLPSAFFVTKQANLGVKQEESLGEKLKAYVQFYNNGLINNSLYQN